MSDIKDIVAEAVKQTLIQLGIDADNPIEIQKDMQHLREWRETTEDLKRKGLLTLLSIFIVGTVGLIIAGITSKHL